MDPIETRTLRHKKQKSKGPFDGQLCVSAGVAQIVGFGLDFYEPLAVLKAETARFSTLAQGVGPYQGPK